MKEESIIVNNLTFSEMYDFECALHHILTCYLNRSTPWTGIASGTAYRHLNSVMLSSDEFAILSKFHDQLYLHLFGSEYEK